jgi:hypothetical protein
MVGCSGTNGCWRRPAGVSFETQVAILIATRADQPVCLLEYTLKSWAAGRALTEKTSPRLLAVSRKLAVNRSGRILGQAARVVGMSKTSILRSIKAGRISAGRDELLVTLKGGS